MVTDFENQDTLNYTIQKYDEYKFLGEHAIDLFWCKASLKIKWIYLYHLKIRCITTRKKISDCIAISYDGQEINAFGHCVSVPYDPPHPMNPMTSRRDWIS